MTDSNYTPDYTLQYHVEQFERGGDSAEALIGSFTVNDTGIPVDDYDAVNNTHIGDSLRAWTMTEWHQPIYDTNQNPFRVLDYDVLINSINTGDDVLEFNILTGKPQSWYSGWYNITFETSGKDPDGNSLSIEVNLSFDFKDDPGPEPTDKERLDWKIYELDSDDKLQEIQSITLHNGKSFKQIVLTDKNHQDIRTWGNLSVECVNSGEDGASVQYTYEVFQNNPYIYVNFTFNNDPSAQPFPSALVKISTAENTLYHERHQYLIINYTEPTQIYFDKLDASQPFSDIILSQAKKTPEFASDSTGNYLATTLNDLIDMDPFYGYYMEDRLIEWLNSEKTESVYGLSNYFYKDTQQEYAQFLPLMYVDNTLEDDLELTSAGNNYSAVYIDPDSIKKLGDAGGEFSYLYTPSEAATPANGYYRVFRDSSLTLQATAPTDYVFSSASGWTRSQNNTVAKLKPDFAAQTITTKTLPSYSLDTSKFVVAYGTRLEPALIVNYTFANETGLCKINPLANITLTNELKNNDIELSSIDVKDHSGTTAVSNNIFSKTTWEWVLPGDVIKFVGIDANDIRVYHTHNGSDTEVGPAKTIDGCPINLNSLYADQSKMPTIDFSNMNSLPFWTKGTTLGPGSVELNVELHPTSYHVTDITYNHDEYGRYGITKSDLLNKSSGGARDGCAACLFPIGTEYLNAAYKKAGGGTIKFKTPKLILQNAECYCLEIGREKVTYIPTGSSATLPSATINLTFTDASTAPSGVYRREIGTSSRIAIEYVLECNTNTSAIMITRAWYEFNTTGTWTKLPAVTDWHEAASWSGSVGPEDEVWHVTGTLNVQPDPMSLTV